MEKKDTLSNDFSSINDQGTFVSSPTNAVSDVPTRVAGKLSLSKQISIYIGSVVLSPFSLYWFFKYKNNPDTKQLAYISLAITIVTFIFTLFTLEAYIRAVNNYLQLYKSTMSTYSGL